MTGPRGSLASSLHSGRGPPSGPWASLPQCVREFAAVPCIFCTVHGVDNGENPIILSPLRSIPNFNLKSSAPAPAAHLITHLMKYIKYLINSTIEFSPTTHILSFIFCLYTIIFYWTYLSNIRDTCHLGNSCCKQFGNTRCAIRPSSSRFSLICCSNTSWIALVIS